MGTMGKMSYFAQRARRYVRKVGFMRAGWELFRRCLGSTVDIRKAAKLLLEPDSGLSPGERSLLEKAQKKIHLADAMYDRGNARQYFEVGLSAVSAIENAIRATDGSLPIDRVLDLPCGYGRVLRFLVCRFPNAVFTACDIDAHGVRFCSRTFRTIPALSENDFDRLQLDQRFNLIWCGSLMTHLDLPRIQALLRFFERHLAERGLCVFTTIGQRPVAWMNEQKKSYGLMEAGREEVVRGYREAGYGYAEYPHNPGVGITAISPERVREWARSAGLRETYREKLGWKDHHDVYGYIRAHGGKT